jgi:phospholipid-binding lipoprotein MlaA
MKIFHWLSLASVALMVWAICGCASQTKGNSPSPESVPVASQSADREPAPESSAQETPDALTAEEKALFEDEWGDAEGTESEEIYRVADPIEPFNRLMFGFNDTMYEWLWRPLSLGYRKVTPRPVRTGIQNFFTNLGAPVRTVGCILQGKGQSAATEVAKFIFNSTFGVLGFVDLFKNYPEMNPDPEDVGQSLAVYGIGDGFYIVWPFIGPSTLRDTVGEVGNAFLDPINYVDPYSAALAVKGVKTVNLLSFRIEDIDSAKKAALDPYEAARNFYIQSRQNHIAK